MARRDYAHSLAVRYHHARRRESRAGFTEGQGSIEDRNACPANLDVPKIMRLVVAGKFGEASAVVRERAPFPLTLGAICFHPCEQSCRRGKVNEPIAICDIKRFAAENDRGGIAAGEVTAGDGERTAATD